MKISYKWLQNYFEEKLPAPEKLAELLTLHSFEVEGVETREKDWVLEVKILPNMAHHCLSHSGIASEISAILSTPMKQFSDSLKDIKTGQTKKKLEINVLEQNFCRRYVGRIIERVEIKPSPQWLKERLESIGQKSINNIVDLANFVMFDIGQPMHIFDADKLCSNNDVIKVEVKKVSGGDLMTTLDGREVSLDENTTIISNNGRPLAIAGIKGGKAAEIGETTKNIIVESANFEPSLVRKVSRQLNILTDSSKRFENDISPHKAIEAMGMLTKLILESADSGDAIVGDIVDYYPNKITSKKIEVSLTEINSLLGISIKLKEAGEIFKRLNFSFEFGEGQTLKVLPPQDRLDIKIKEDLIEEIGRFYGYEKIKEREVPLFKSPVAMNKIFHYKNKIRNILVQEGFSEVYTYAFTNKGDVELENPIASDKNFLRENLRGAMKKTLDFNLHHADPLGLEQIKIFEIGKVFSGDKEKDLFAIGVKNTVNGKGVKKDGEEIKMILDVISKELGEEVEALYLEDGIVEIDLENFIAKLAEPISYRGIEIKCVKKNVKYKKISPYPFVLRDIAVFVPGGVRGDEVSSIIERETGEILVNKKLFDVFAKKFPDGKTKISYAFRLAFQAQDRTLTDEEVNKIMENVSKSLNNRDGWQVR